MLPAARVVERLRLRGESESAIRHSLPALEDAFRTASLPDTGARLLCVRRLHLGRIPSNARPQAVARHIEERFATAGWRVVHAGDASANDAQAVWFRDRFEVHEIAALRLAAGRPLDAWFWPLALPGVMAQPADQRFRAMAFAIAATEEAPCALPAWTAALVGAGCRDRLVASLRPGDGDALLRAAGVSPVALQRARTVVARFTQAPVDGLRGGPLDDRQVFVEAIAGDPRGPVGGQTPGEGAVRASTPVIDRAARPSQDQTFATESTSGAVTPARRRRYAAPAQRVREKAQRITGWAEVEDNAPAASVRGGEPAGRGPLASDHVQPAGQEPPPAAVAGLQPGEPGMSRPPVARNGGATADAGNQSPVDDREPLASSWPLLDAAPTSAGGLLFLLPVLAQVGFAKWAAERAPEGPEPEFLAAEVLHLLLSRLRVAKDDPMWELVAAWHSPLARDFVAANTWLTACRRFLRRRVGIGLANLVLRPAGLVMTHTHIDVFFKLTAVDLRIRRAGLDIDPGWVPWFKRVVTFYYGGRPWN